MCVSVPTKYAPSQVIKILKGESAEYLRKKCPDLAKRYWGLQIWARGYFVRTVGSGRDVIKQYVQKQQDHQIRNELKLWKDSSRQRMTLSGVAGFKKHRQGRWSCLSDDILINPLNISGIPLLCKILKHAGLCFAPHCAGKLWII